jgi:hypothetical protein
MVQQPLLRSYVTAILIQPSKFRLANRLVVKFSDASFCAMTGLVTSGFCGQRQACPKSLIQSRMNFPRALQDAAPGFVLVSER